MVESHGVRLDNFTTRLVAKQKSKGSYSVIDTMRVELSSLKVHAHQLRSTDMSMIWGEVFLPNVFFSMTLMIPFSEYVDDEERANDELAEETYMDEITW